MKPAFNILPESFDQEQTGMIIEAGNYGISFTWFTRLPEAVIGILVYNFDRIFTPTEWISALNEIFREQPILKNQYSSVCFCVNFPETLFIPGELYNQASAKELINRTYQLGPESMIQTDVLKEQKLFNIYGVRNEIQEFFQFQYPRLKTAHSSSQELQYFLHSNAITCIVYHNSFKVFVINEGKFLFSGIFDYNKPVDTAYYLLRICETYGLNPEEISLNLCGMIDEYSILYNEIYKYFMNVTFLPAREGVNFHERIRFYPSHFFSHQTFLITCAS